jgi:hypothetical protein
MFSMFGPRKAWESNRQRAAPDRPMSFAVSCYDLKFLRHRSHEGSLLDRYSKKENIHDASDISEPFEASSCADQTCAQAKGRHQGLTLRVRAWLSLARWYTLGAQGIM